MIKLMSWEIRCPGTRSTSLTTRALSELILVVDDQVADYDDGSSQETMNQTKTPKAQPAAKKKKSKKGVLNYKAGQKKDAVSGVAKETSGSIQNGQSDLEKPLTADAEEKDTVSTEPAVSLGENIDSANTDTQPAQAMNTIIPESLEDGSYLVAGSETPDSSMETAVTEETTPKISPALKELHRGYVEITTTGAVTGIGYLVPYNGKLRNYTTKKATAMIIPQIRAGKETKVPVSVVEEDRIIFIAKDLYKMYEKGLKQAEELELIL